MPDDVSRFESSAEYYLRRDITRLEAALENQVRDCITRHEDNQHRIGSLENTISQMKGIAYTVKVVWGIICGIVGSAVTLAISHLSTTNHH